MTSTVHSCKTQIKELEDANRTLVLENKDLLTALGEILGTLAKVENEIVFNLPPVSIFKQVIRNIIGKVLCQTK